MYNAKGFKSSPLFSGTLGDPAVPETRLSEATALGPSHAGGTREGESFDRPLSPGLSRFPLGIMVILLEGVRGKLTPDLRVSDDLWIVGKPEKPSWGLQPGRRAYGSFPR